MSALIEESPTRSDFERARASMDRPHELEFFDGLCV